MATGDAAVLAAGASDVTLLAMGAAAVYVLLAVLAVVPADEPARTVPRALVGVLIRARAGS